MKKLLVAIVLAAMVISAVPLICGAWVLTTGNEDLCIDKGVGALPNWMDVADLGPGFL